MEITKGDKLKYAVSGAFAGAVNGLFGGGGGTLLVPLLSGWAKLDEGQLFPTSVAVTAPMCAVSAGVYILRRGVDIATALPYLVGGLLGGIISGLLMKRLPRKLLRRVFALLIIYGGLRSLLWA